MRQAMLEVAGVTTAEVTYDDARAIVTYRPELVAPSALVQAVEDAGFDAQIIEMP